MAALPQSPSRCVPGAWPASPKQQNGTPHYLRSTQRSVDLHYRKASIAQPRFNSRVTGPSTLDDTPTSFASDGLSSHSSLANTSFSSAYTSPATQDTFPSRQRYSKPRQKIESKKDQVQNSTTAAHFSPGRENENEFCAKHDTSFAGTPGTQADQTLLTLPEIPDFASFSSLREELQISRGSLNERDSSSNCQLCLDESFLEAHTISLQHDSLDNLSSSSIRFRQTTILAHDSLDIFAESLGLPQQAGHDSWSLFLSPTPISSEGVLQTGPDLEPSTGSRYRITKKAFSAIRKSREVTANTPEDIDSQEETSVTRFARDILANALDTGSTNLALDIPKLVSDPMYLYPLPLKDANQHEHWKHDACNDHIQPKVKLLHAVKRIQRKVRRTLTKLVRKDDLPGKSQDPIPDVQKPRSRQALTNKVVRSPQRAFSPIALYESKNRPPPRDIRKTADTLASHDLQPKEKETNPRASAHFPYDSKNQRRFTAPPMSNGLPIYRHGLLSSRKLHTRAPVTTTYGNRTLDILAQCKITDEIQQKNDPKTLESIGHRKHRRSFLSHLSSQPDRKH